MIFSQVVYQDLNYASIYDFLDEMASLGVISINSSVKPYSRMFIALKLQEIQNKQENLNKRQKKDLVFFMRDYNLELRPDLAYSKSVPGIFRKKEHFGIPLSPLAFIYKDSLFTISVRPVWGINYFYNGNGTAYHRWGGAEIAGYIGKHFGFYASLRDNHENKILVDPDYLTRDEGAAWKLNTDGSGDYSEMRGGVTFAWNWGSVALVKDHFRWGDNSFGSTIFSGRTPSFPYIQLRMNPARWVDFTYIHGWMVSQVVDSSLSWQVPNSTEERQYFFNKFMAASMLTFTPWKNLYLSAGNSVVYCAAYPNPAFLSPFLFFVDFDYTSQQKNRPPWETDQYGNNAQLFFNVGSRQIRHLYLYGSVFLDGFNRKAFTDAGRHNFISYQAGFRVSDFPFSNISLTTEYTMSNPMTYKSVNSTLTYASNLYNLGYFLRDNSQDICVKLGYRPLRGLDVNVTFEQAEHGTDLQYDQVADPYAVPVLTGLTWQSRKMGASVKYEFTNNAYVFLEYMNNNNSGDPQYTPPYLTGNTNTLMTGFNIGF